MLERKVGETGRAGEGALEMELRSHLLSTQNVTSFAVCEMLGSERGPRCVGAW